MNRLDRYLFVQHLGPFGFFTLALAGILWLAQTLPLVEIVIDSGRSGLIFLEFSSLLLPNVLSMILPISAFIATIFTVNKLYTESEMVVAMAAGVSPIRIAKSTLLFGIFVMMGMYIVVIALLPIANTRLGDQIQIIKRDALGTFLREKQFIHPAPGITIYIKDSSKAGEIIGMFLHDQRDPNSPVTYSAHQALLQQNQNGDKLELRLVMSNGIAQRYSVKENTVNTVEFSQFVFDLSDLVNQTHSRNRLPVEYTLPELLAPQKLIDAGATRPFGAYFAEGHNKLAQPMLALILPLFAVAMLLSAKYRRSGLGVRITITSVLGITALILTLAAKSWVSAEPGQYLAAYFPPLITLLVAGMLLLRANNKGHWKTRVLKGGE
ncbi:MAG: LptF/LptG family permease [Paracoccaceae bacterium]